MMSMSAKEYFFQKLSNTPDRKNINNEESVKKDIKTFQTEVSELVCEIRGWLSGAAVIVSAKTMEFHDNSVRDLLGRETMLRRYNIEMLRIINGTKQVLLEPNCLYGFGVIGRLSLIVEHTAMYPRRQTYSLIMEDRGAERKGWLIARDDQPSVGSIQLTEESFFQAIIGLI